MFPVSCDYFFVEGDQSLLANWAGGMV